MTSRQIAAAMQSKTIRLVWIPTKCCCDDSQMILTTSVKIEFTDGTSITINGCDESRFGFLYPGLA